MMPWYQFCFEWTSFDKLRNVPRNQQIALQLQSTSGFANSVFVGQSAFSDQQGFADLGQQINSDRVYNDLKFWALCSEIATVEIVVPNDSITILLLATTWSLYRAGIPLIQRPRRWLVSKPNLNSTTIEQYKRVPIFQHNAGLWFGTFQRCRGGEKALSDCGTTGGQRRRFILCIGKSNTYFPNLINSDG